MNIAENFPEFKRFNEATNTSLQTQSRFRHQGSHSHFNITSGFVSNKFEPVPMFSRNPHLTANSKTQGHLMHDFVEQN